VSEPRPDDEEVDRQFREIVAGLGGGDPQDARVNPSPWPEARPPGRPAHLGTGTPEGMATDHRSYEPPEDEEDDHFVPPPPPPLPAGDLHFWAIVVGLVGGPLMVLLSVVIPVLPPAFGTVGVLAGITGFVLLVLRQPPRRGRDGGGDLGAQV
jgi:hypothetical protein